MVSAVASLAAVDRLLSAAADGTLDALCERLGVRVLGVFGSAARQHRRPDPSARPRRDVDLAERRDTAHLRRLDLEALRR